MHTVTLYAGEPNPLEGNYTSPILPTEDKMPWQYDILGDKHILSCTLENENSDIFTKIGDIFKKNKIELPNTDGICKVMNYTNVLGTIMNVFTEGGYFNPSDLIGDFVGITNIGNSFDLGGFAQCNINLPDTKNTLLSKFCESNSTEDRIKNLLLSPAATMASLTVEGLGLPSFSGKENAKPIKKVDEREYPSKMTGKELFREGNDSDGNPVKGGYLLAKAADDPQGSTALAFKTFDKATIVLKTLAATNIGNDEANATALPATKADSIDMEDEIVGLQTRMATDFIQFDSTLTRALQKKVSEIDMKDGGKELMSLARYGAKEKEVANEVFRSKASGLSDIYKGIEEDVKARMASEMLLMTTDPNYIADPSEARLALIKPSQRNAFRYAALIQQEKNKQLKLKYALEIKRKQQIVDLIKKQAQIRASVFRDSAARHELDVLLSKVDESVDLEMNSTNNDRDGG